MSSSFTRYHSEHYRAFQFQMLENPGILEAFVFRTLRNEGMAGCELSMSHAIVMFELFQRKLHSTILLYRSF